MRVGCAYDVAAAAAQIIDRVSEIYSTSGQHDLMMKLYLDAGDEVGRLVTSRVPTVDGVEDTLTIIILEALT